MPPMVQNQALQAEATAAPEAVSKRNRFGGLARLQSKLLRSKRADRYSNAVKSTAQQRRGSCSTVIVDADECSSSCEIRVSPLLPHKKKKVRFESSGNLEQVYPPRVFQDDEDSPAAGRSSSFSDELYLKSTYFRKLKSELSGVADDVRSQGFSSLLDFFYEERRGTSEDDKVKSQALLSEWVRKKEDLRGLESLSKRRPGSKRQIERVRHVRSILRLQSTIPASQARSTSKKHHATPELQLQRASEASSHPAAVTARMFGIADEAAVSADGDYWMSIVGSAEAPLLNRSSSSTASKKNPLRPIFGRQKTKSIGI